MVNTPIYKVFDITESRYLNVVGSPLYYSYEEAKGRIRIEVKYSNNRCDEEFTIEELKF